MLDAGPRTANLKPMGKKTGTTRMMKAGDTHSVLNMAQCVRANACCILYFCVVRYTMAARPDSRFQLAQIVIGHDTMSGSV